MRARLPGILVFLPVPLVLWLFLQGPLGGVASLGLGAVLMLTHRFYARPFARRRAPSLCLWCAGRAGEGPTFPIEEPSGTTAWRACGAAHLDRLARFFGWAGGHALFLRLGILGALVVFLPGALLAEDGRLGPLNREDTVAFFRASVALTVLPLGWLSLRFKPFPGAAPRVPFPVHVPALVGTVVVMWLFRLVGLVWLGLGLAYALQRAGIL